MNKIAEYLETIAKFCDYLIHPTKIFIAFWNWTVEISYILFLSIAVFSLIAYILGCKKASKLIPISFGFYTLIQAIGKVLS